MLEKSMEVGCRADRACAAVSSWPARAVCVGESGLSVCSEHLCGVQGCAAECTAAPLQREVGGTRCCV